MQSRIDVGNFSVAVDEAIDASLFAMAVSENGIDG